MRWRIRRVVILAPRASSHKFLHQSAISAKNVARLENLTGHEDHEVAELAALILEIARVLPGKRTRWLKLAQHDRPLFDRTLVIRSDDSGWLTCDEPYLCLRCG